MGNDNETRNPYRTLLAQFVKIGSMVLEGPRRIEEVIKYLQPVIAGTNFTKQIDVPSGRDQLVKKKEALGTLLTSAWMVSVPAMDETFNALDRFVKDTSEMARVKISCVGEKFESLFGGITVGPHTGSVLAFSMLLRNIDFSDLDLLLAPGDEDGVGISLAEIYWLMEQQKNGEKGILYVDRQVNIFFVRDRYGLFRSVVVGWNNDGWCVDSFSSGLLTRLKLEGARIFLPDNSL